MGPDKLPTLRVQLASGVLVFLPAALVSSVVSRPVLPACSVIAGTCKWGASLSNGSLEPLHPCNINMSTFTQTDSKKSANTLPFAHNLPLLPRFPGPPTCQLATRKGRIAESTEGPARMHKRWGSGPERPWGRVGGGAA